MTISYTRVLNSINYSQNPHRMEQEGAVTVFGIGLGLVSLPFDKYGMVTIDTTVYSIDLFLCYDLRTQR